jgi:aryl-alcohol dehydrogenase-like predicted oxidoreductase
MGDFRKDSEHEDRVARAVLAVAKEVNATAAQVALAWQRYAAVPVIPIIGARKLTQLQDNLGSAGVKLNEAQRRTLDEASSITLGFPHDFYANPMVRNFVYGGLRERIKA